MQGSCQLEYSVYKPRVQTGLGRHCTADDRRLSVYLHFRLQTGHVALTAARCGARSPDGSLSTHPRHAYSVHWDIGTHASLVSGRRRAGYQARLMRTTATLGSGLMRAAGCTIKPLATIAASSPDSPLAPKKNLRFYFSSGRGESRIARPSW